METKKAHGAELATPGKRILATLIDAIIAGLVTFVVTLPFGAVSILTALSSSQAQTTTDWAALTAANQGTNFISGLLGVVVWVLVFLVVPIYVWNGQTLGKKILNLKIVREDGKATEAMDIVKRYSIYLVVNVLNIIPFIGAVSACVAIVLPVVNLVMLFTDERRQTVLDKVGQTLVVEA